VLPAARLGLSGWPAQLHIFDSVAARALGRFGRAAKSTLTGGGFRVRFRSCEITQGTIPLNRNTAPSAQEVTPEAPPSAETSEDDQSRSAPSTVILERLLLDRLDDEKAQDVVFIDLKDKSSVADGMIVASGRSHRHVGAMADHLLRALKDAGHGRARVEGLPHCDWVLIDAGDVIVHLFRPEVRAFYNIEKIWSVEPPRRAVN
jgi:ribosome-associated protein